MCTCQYGLGVHVVDQSLCDPHDAAICGACDPGHTLTAGQCPSTFTCVCPNGVRAVGLACPAEGLNICESCIGAYHLAESPDTGYDICYPNICVCEHGIPKTHENGCRKHEANICHSCVGAFHLEGDNCVPNVCRCDNGVPMTGPNCTVHDAQNCDTCDIFSTLRTDGDTYCAWVPNNENTEYGEVMIGSVDSTIECIAEVQKYSAKPGHDCANLGPNGNQPANVANLEGKGSGECWCQFGDNDAITEDLADFSWMACLLDKHVHLFIYDMILIDYIL